MSSAKGTRSENDSVKYWTTCRIAPGQISLPLSHTHNGATLVLMSAKHIPNMFPLASELLAEEMRHRDKRANTHIIIVNIHPFLCL